MKIGIKHSHFTDCLDKSCILNKAECFDGVFSQKGPTISIVVLFFTFTKLSLPQWFFSLSRLKIYIEIFDTLDVMFWRLWFGKITLAMMHRFHNLANLSHYLDEYISFSLWAYEIRNKYTINHRSAKTKIFRSRPG